MTLQQRLKPAEACAVTHTSINSEPYSRGLGLQHSQERQRCKGVNYSYILVLAKTRISLLG